MAEQVPIAQSETPRHLRPVGARAPQSLLVVDPELTAGIPADDRELAHRVLTRPVEDVPPGDLALDGPFAAGDALGALIVEGAVIRQMALIDRQCTSIFGAGDIVAAPPADAMPTFPVTWRALEPTQLIVLDTRFTLAAQRWPSLMVNLHRRMVEHSHRIAVQAAITQLPRVELRILTLLWHLAERWGRVGADGVEVRLQLTHEALGRLIGAQRPTVTLALRDLVRQGALMRTDRRTWLLANESHELVRPAG